MGTEGTGPRADDVLTWEKIQKLVDDLGPPPKRMKIIAGWPPLSSRGKVFRAEGQEWQLWFIHPSHVKELESQQVQLHHHRDFVPLLGTPIEHYKEEHHIDLIAQVLTEAGVMRNPLDYEDL